MAGLVRALSDPRVINAIAIIVIVVADSMEKRWRA